MVVLDVYMTLLVHISFTGTIIGVPKDSDGASTNLQCPGNPLAAPHHITWCQGASLSFIANPSIVKDV